MVKEVTLEDFLDDFKHIGVSKNKGPSYGNEEIFESHIPKDRKLKKEDLYDYRNISVIRNYMSRKKGMGYKTASPKKVVEEFVNHMRNFNSNAVSTAGEVMFISRGSDEDKKAANAAYELYDSLGNVFVNDGFYGAADGVRDYVYSAVTDPTNYIGAFTGGFGKMAAVGINQSSRRGIKAAASAAAKRAALSGATRSAAQNAAIEAGTIMTQKMIKNSASSAAATKQAQIAAREIYRSTISKAASEGVRDFMKGRYKEQAKRAVKYTTAFDALSAAIQTDAIQDIYLDVGAQEKYSIASTAFSTLLGGVAGGLHYTFGKFDGASGLGDAMADLNSSVRAKTIDTRRLENVEEQLKKVKADAKKVPELKDNLAKLKEQEASATSEKTKQKISENIRSLQQRITDTARPEYFEARIKDLKKKSIGPRLLSEKAQQAAAKTIKDNLVSWASKVESGKSKLANAAMPEGMVNEIFFGDDGKGGVAKILRDNGIKLQRGTKVSDLATNIIRYMDDDYLQDISEIMYDTSGIHLGDLDNLAVDVGDVIAAEISRAGTVLSVSSRLRRAIDGGVVAGNEILMDALETKEVRDTLEEEFKLARRAKALTYGQNVWKRLLVSSPATTAANVFGFGQFYIGQSLADTLTGGMLRIAAIAKGGGKTEKGRELIRQADVYKRIQAQKMLNLLDPFTTHDAYMDFLNKHKDVKGLLFETVGAAVERGTKRYGIDETNKIVYGPFGVENFTRAAMDITGVRIQDSFTKSTMFMTEMDKYLRLKKKRTLIDVLKKGDLEAIDDDVIGGALDTTMRSVFSKDYTTEDQYLAGAAKLVEQISNTPGLGTILPFGRFMNNVVATAYQWSPLSFMGAASRITRKSERDIKALEAMSRSLVGTTALTLAMHHSEEQEKKGLAYNEVEVSGGTIVDVRNVFPYSLFLAAGRGLNLKRKGEPIPKEVQEDILNQLAIGQVARDTQFANDLYNIFDYLSGEEGAREAGLDSLYKTVGGITAGLTRPLDAVNRAVGFITETDMVKDPRQARGGAVFTQQATKYFDNIIEAFIGETETLTGEKLRVATREGDLYDANPLARIFGLTVKRGKTAAEKAYSMAEMKVWTADSRTKMTQYDRIFNSSIAPLLEPKMNKLVESKAFKEADLAKRRDMVRGVLSNAKATIRNYLDSTSGDNFLARLRYKASTKGNKDQKSKAMKFMREQHGVTGRLEDFNYRELQMYNSYIKHLQYIGETNF